MTTRIATIGGTYSTLRIVVEGSNPPGMQLDGSGLERALDHVMGSALMGASTFNEKICKIIEQTNPEVEIIENTSTAKAEMDGRQFTVTIEVSVGCKLDTSTMEELISMISGAAAVCLVTCVPEMLGLRKELEPSELLSVFDPFAGLPGAVCIPLNSPGAAALDELALLLAQLTAVDFVAGMTPGTTEPTTLRREHRSSRN